MLSWLVLVSKDAYMRLWRDEGRKQGEVRADYRCCMVNHRLGGA